MLEPDSLIRGASPVSEGTTPRRFTLKIGFQEFQLPVILASHFVANAISGSKTGSENGMIYAADSRTELGFVGKKQKSPVESIGL